MARRSNKQEEEITPEGIRRAMELDKDKINAALAAAVTNRDGSHPDPGFRNPVSGNRNLGPEPAAPAETTDDSFCPDCEASKGETGKNGSEKTSKISKEREAFGKSCFNLDIDAKRCFEQSSKNPDKNIMEYLRAINKKIFDETQRGGFSTNVQFRVTQQDWVNISHITDWYKARGFTIPKFETSSAPYGKSSGTIEYNFTISWAEA